MKTENKKVLLGMSGGVDSSVSALLLKEQGYDVVGTTLELFVGSSCCNVNTYIDAKNVCKTIGVPHFTFDYKDEFKKHVIDDFINCYDNQQTPNPCIECNRYLKFGSMYEKAKELGCEYIATGHYAKTEYSEKYGRYVLKKANNIAKDQSYVLYTIPKELLGKVLFPLGEFESKDEVRKVARENNLKVASKPDSEDICFIPDGDYKKFLENNSNIKQIYLHFDNDEIGEKASKALMEKLSNKYEVIDNRPPVGKDCNDYLKYVLDFQNINRQANNKRIYEKVR